VIVKGDRKATLGEDAGQIVDLADEKVYDLDLKRKTYTVTTFAELRRRFEDQQRKAAENARKEEPSAKQVTVREKGKTPDMWLAPTVKAMRDVAGFKVAK